MKRGDIVGMVGPGDFAARPRPALVVQADAFNGDHPAFTVCPITSRVTGDFFYRVPIGRGAATGLRDDSEIEIDRIQAIRRERIGPAIGWVPEETMFAVDQALRRWLEL